MDYWTQVEPYWDRVSIYDGPAQFLAQFALVPESIGHLYASHFAQSEICNGGMHQLFWNDTGVLVPEAIVGFRALKLDVLADVLGQAASAFGPLYPREYRKRREMLDTWPSNVFESMDDIFFAHMDSMAEPNAYERAAETYAIATMPSNPPNAPCPLLRPAR